MLFDRVVGNLRTGGPVPIDDHLDLQWHECFRRASRQVARSGRPVRLLLSLGTWLRDGDVVCDGVTRLAIHVVPCDVLLIRPADARQATLIGLGLGNLHAPLQCGSEELITLPDGPIEQLLVQLGARFERCRRCFEPETVAAPLRAQLAADFQIWTASQAGVPGSSATTRMVAAATAS